MRASALIALAGAATLAAGASFAQTADTAVNPPAATADAAPSATVTPPPASSDTLGNAATMKAGDPGVVSNGPVPDTPANRAAYGKPMSHAGRATAPAGN